MSLSTCFIVGGGSLRGVAPRQILKCDFVTSVVIVIKVEFCFSCFCFIGTSREFIGTDVELDTQ